jgi:plastocyanin
MRTGTSFALSAAALLAACGGSGGGNGGGSCNPGSTAAFTIKNTGISPSANCVQLTGTVSFNNTDTAAHTITSPDCTELNNVTVSAPPSGTQTVTFAAAASKICTFSVSPGGTAFQGTLAVTNAVAQGPGY